LEQLRERFGQLGELGSRFLEGLLKKQRCGKHQAGRVLALVSAYHRQDVLAALERAVRYHAYSHSSLERILQLQATPKPSWQLVSPEQQDTLRKLTGSDSLEARSSADYQYLLFEEHDSHDASQDQQAATPAADPPASGDAEHSADE
jgi:hypothetical protein